MSKPEPCTLPKIVLISEDLVSFPIPTHVIQSGTSFSFFFFFVLTNFKKKVCSREIINGTSFTNVPSMYLEKIVKYANLRFQNCADVKDDEVDDYNVEITFFLWEKLFLEDIGAVAFPELFLFAKDCKIEPLVKLLAKKTAWLIRGKSFEEIAHCFGIPQLFTDEERQ